MEENTNNGTTPSAEIANQENVFVALDEDANKFINPGYSNDSKGKRKPVETDPVTSNRRTGRSARQFSEKFCQTIRRSA